MIAGKKSLWDKECSSFIDKIEPEYQQRMEEIRLNGANYWLNAFPVIWRPR